MVSLIVSLCSLYICHSVLTFGFEPTEYSVNEGDGPVDLGISFINSNSGEFLPRVIISTIDGTATGEYYVIVS